jgi:phosphoglucosamine mutase
MDAAGIVVRTTAVGDRYVREEMEAGGYGLGGEQSGHLIFRRLATTGDGILTGLAVLDVVARSGRPLAGLAGAAMTRLPQVLHNVVVAGASARSALATADRLWDEVRAVEAELGPQGRVLLRPSGTEPLVRVMVEAPTAERAEALAARVVKVVEQCLTPSTPRSGDEVLG